MSSQRLDISPGLIAGSGARKQARDLFVFGYCSCAIDALELCSFLKHRLGIAGDVSGAYSATKKFPGSTAFHTVFPQRKNWKIEYGGKEFANGRAAVGTGFFITVKTNPKAMVGEGVPRSGIDCRTQAGLTKAWHLVPLAAFGRAEYSRRILVFENYSATTILTALKHLYDPRSVLCYVPREWPVDPGEKCELP